MEEVNNSEAKREQPSYYGLSQPNPVYRMQSADSAGLHPTYPPATVPGGMSTFAPPPSPYEGGVDHRQHLQDSTHHPHYASQAYAPPPPPPQSREHPAYDTAYSRPGSISAPTRSPAEAQPPPSFHAVNGTGPSPPDGQYYPTHGLPDNRPRYGYGPPESPANGTYPPPQHPLHVNTNQEIMSGQPPSAGPYGQPTPHTPMYPTYYSQQPEYLGQRRKPVRAAQACDSCRQRKAKCDEGRPECTHCKENSLKCTYREIPAPKQEKQVSAINEKLESMNESILQKMSLMLEKQEIQGRQLQLLQALIPESKISAFQAMNNSSSYAQAGTPIVPKVPRISEISTLCSKCKGDNEKELSLPFKHYTAAQYLMAWPTIRSLIPAKIQESYVMDLESSRGLLRLYGCGEGDDKFDGHEGAKTPSDNSLSGEKMEEDVISTPSPGGPWGSGQMPPRSPAPGFADKDHAGGVSIHGGLVLEEAVIDRYYKSYMDNMFILHPFLDAKVLKDMIRTFKKRYSPDIAHFKRSNPGKRKREPEDSQSWTNDNSAPNNYIRPAPKYPARPVEIEHSIANAIVLFVIALGKICAHREPLPGPAPAAEKQLGATSTPHTAYSDLPLGPSSSAPNSPYHRNLKMESHPAISSPADPRGKNMDVIPGLAYFAKGADIMGELPGGGDVSHVQANLLAGLYMGQLARIIPSHYYISNACKAIIVLIESAHYKENGMRANKRDLINVAFWSCLQLESDILAEVELPPSGISRYEAQQRDELPNGLSLDMPEDEVARSPVMFFYSSQVQLRRTLNDVHGWLYKDKTFSQCPALSFIKALDESLDQWRKRMAISTPQYAWHDDDHQSPDVNVARLRGKYYGAKYIIHRPALSYALAHSKKHPMPSYPTSQPEIHPSYNDQFPNSTTTPRLSRSTSDMAPPPDQNIDAMDPQILRSAETCVQAAIRSTTAFDAVPERLIITNIFGTAHAQFGNMLVLSATWNSELRHLVDYDTLQRLFTRTIRFLRLAEAISPTLAEDARILKEIKRTLFSQNPGSASQTSSFSGM